MNDDENKNNVAKNYSINKNKTTTSRSFECMTKIIGIKPVDNNTLCTEVVVPLKYLSNFLQSFHLSLINYEIKLDLSQSRDCISEISRTHATAAHPAVVTPTPTKPAKSTTGATFQINSYKLYVPVFTLPIKNNLKFLENLKKEFKQTIYWNKYRFETTMQLRNNNLDYMIDQIFRNIYRFFVLSFNINANDNDDFPERNSFHKYYLPLVEIKDLKCIN